MTMAYPKRGIGDVIKRWRVQSGMTPSQLAARIEKGRSYVCELENGSGGCRLSTAAKICRVFGKSVDQLVEESGL